MKLREYLERWLPGKEREDAFKARLGELQAQAPVPVFWLFGKTQSGKTSIIKYLTGAADAEIGAGFKPTTRFSRQYDFPAAEAPLLTFLDSRGLDEAGYDSGEDIARFHELAHVVLVTVRVTDHAQEHVLDHLKQIRADKPSRPIVLALTCLHEAYPQQQHPQTYPFTKENILGAAQPEGVGDELWRSLVEQRTRFSEFADHFVAVDLTRPEEGFNPADYGGAALKATLHDLLPDAFRQTFEHVEELIADIRGWHDRRAMPYVLGYSTLAATAGAFPVPWINLLVLPGLQRRMVQHLAELYGRPETGEQFLELASGLGAGLTARQAWREFSKFIPGVGPVAAAALAGRSTYALGKAFCHYYGEVHAGHAPQISEIRRVYEEQLSEARRLWSAEASGGSERRGLAPPEQ